jgi:hypothetical protein
MVVLACDDAVVHPHRELTPTADDELGVDAERLVDERGRTGRTRAVVSGAAEADADVLHDSPSVDRSDAAQARMIVPAIRKG